MSLPLDHTIDPFRYEQLREDYRALFQPENRYIADKVDDLAAKRFHLDRLKAVHCQYMREVYAEFGGAVQDMELFVSAKESILMRLETRIRQAEAAMSRLERDIQRLKKFFPPPQCRVPDLSEAQETPALQNAPVQAAAPAPPVRIAPTPGPLPPIPPVPGSGLFRPPDRSCT